MAEGHMVFRKLTINLIMQFYCILTAGRCFVVAAVLAFIPTCAIGEASSKSSIVPTDPFSTPKDQHIKDNGWRTYPRASQGPRKVVKKKDRTNTNNRRVPSCS
eukprot:scaffold11698_cov138-Cylindrotheca_fusiformis.AAC.4